MVGGSIPPACFPRMGTTTTTRESEHTMSETYKQETHGDYTVTVFYDEAGEWNDPRQWENLGTMVCGHRDYILGDVQVRPGERWEAPDDVAVVLPLGLYDHSGISMYVGGGAHAFDPGGWDSGTVGVIYVTSADLVREYGADTPETRERAEKHMRLEVETYDQWMRGDVYGYRVERECPTCPCCGSNPGPETVEACGGYFDADDAMHEALSFVPADQRQVTA